MNKFYEESIYPIIIKTNITIFTYKILNSIFKEFNILFSYFNYFIFKLFFFILILI